SVRDRLTHRPEPSADRDRAVLVMHDVTMEYPNGNVALRDVDLVIPEGDFVFIVGPSGPGKSTVTRPIPPEGVAPSGQVILDGAGLARLPRRGVPKVRRKIGTIFQDFKLLPR